jgi:hypothetical protein
MGPEDISPDGGMPRYYANEFVDPVTTQELIEYYDKFYEEPRDGYPMHKHLRDALEGGGDINNTHEYMGSLAMPMLRAAQDDDLDHITRSTPMNFSAEDPVREGYEYYRENSLPSAFIERMYNELIRRATGFQDGGMVGPDIPQEWLDAVGEAADLYGLPEEVLTALITQESNWDPSAVSPKGAVGLTQVLPATAAEMLPGYSKQGIATLLQDPIHQISLGARHLSGLRDRFEGSLTEALAVYNSGAGTRDAPRVRYFDEAGERQRVFDTTETQNYLLDIMDRARGDESEMYTRRRSEDRTPEERRALIEDRFYAVPGARYDYEGDSYTPIRPMMRPDPGF